jgi:hypothetical protein
MNKHLLSSESPFILRYVQAGLAEQQMVILAAIIRDLDRETARTETGLFVIFIIVVVNININKHLKEDLIEKCLRALTLLKCFET